MSKLNEALIALHEYIEAREDKGDMEELKDIYNAFKDADGWLPYPENQPEKRHSYMVQYKNAGYGFMRYFTEGLWPDIIAFRELPATYQPKQDKP